MSGNVTPLPLCAFMACVGKTLLFTFYDQTKGIWFKSIRNFRRNFLNPYKIRDLKYEHAKQARMVKNEKLRKIQPF
jgi:hypothetical protein